MVFLYLNQTPGAAQARPINQAASPSNLWRIQKGDVSYTLPINARLILNRSHSPTALILPPFDTTTLNNYEVIDPYGLPRDFSEAYLKKYIMGLPLLSENTTIKAKAGYSKPDSTSSVYELVIGKKSSDSDQNAVFRAQIITSLWKIAIRAYPKSTFIKAPAESEPIKLNQDLQNIIELSDRLIKLGDEYPAFRRSILNALTAWPNENPLRIGNLSDEIYHFISHMISQSQSGDLINFQGLTNKETIIRHGLFSRESEDIVGEKPKSREEGLGEFPDKKSVPKGDQVDPNEETVGDQVNPQESDDIDNSEETWSVTSDQTETDEGLDTNRILTPEEIAEIDNDAERELQRNRLILYRITEDETIGQYGQRIWDALNRGNRDIEGNGFLDIARRTRERIIEITNEVVNQINHHRGEGSVMTMTTLLLRAMVNNIDRDQLNPAELNILQQLGNLDISTHQRNIIALTILIRGNQQLEHPDDIQALIRFVNRFILADGNISEGLVEFNRAVNENIINRFQDQVDQLRQHLDERIAHLRDSEIGGDLQGLRTDELQKLGQKALEALLERHDKLVQIGEDAIALIRQGEIDPHSPAWRQIRERSRELVLRIFRNTGAREHIGFTDENIRDVAIAALQTILQNDQVPEEQVQLVTLLTLALAEEEANRFDHLVAVEALSIQRGNAYAPAYLEFTYLIYNNETTPEEISRWFVARVDQIYQRRIRDDLPEARNQIVGLFIGLYTPDLAAQINHLDQIRGIIGAFLPALPQQNIAQYFPLIDGAREILGPFYNQYVAEVIRGIAEQRGVLTEQDLNLLLRRTGYDLTRDIMAEIRAMPHTARVEERQLRALTLLGEILYPNPGQTQTETTNPHNIIYILDFLINILPTGPTQYTVNQLRERLIDNLRYNIRQITDAFRVEHPDITIFHAIINRYARLISDGQFDAAHQLVTNQRLYVWELFTDPNAARATQILLQIDFIRYRDHGDHEFFNQHFQLWGRLNQALQNIPQNSPILPHLQGLALNHILNLMTEAIIRNGNQGFEGIQNLIQRIIDQQRANQRAHTNVDLTFTLHLILYALEQNFELRDGMSQNLTDIQRQELINQIHQAMNL